MQYLLANLHVRKSKVVFYTDLLGRFPRPGSVQGGTYGPRVGLVTIMVCTEKTL